MCVNDVAGESAIYYPIHLMMQKIRFLIVLTHLLSTFMVEVANLKECGIKRSKTSKACKK
jgi:hypothetical protein